jgi:hypothetical protein
VHDDLTTGCLQAKSEVFMAQQRRMLRRIAGVLNARLPEVRLDAVADPRMPRGKRWKELATLLRAAIVGVIAGCRSTSQVEALTAEMSVAMRRFLKIPRRLPDTTLRTTLIGLQPDELRNCLYAQVRAAHRRKALTPLGLPFGHVAIDGKATAIGAWDNRYAQKQTHSAGQGANGIARTLTAALVSTRATVCLDAAPIPPKTNEMGHFQTALRQLTDAYGSLDLLQVISGDAGLCSEANARAICDHGLDYLLGLKGDQPSLLLEAQRLLHRRSDEQAVAETVDVVGKSTVTRRLFITTDMAGYLNWTHLQTVLRVQSVTRIIDPDAEAAEGAELQRHHRYFLSSLSHDALTNDQWLMLVRNHWGVENGCHQVWDKFFAEDDKPWIESGDGASQGTVVVMLLRRIGVNLLALFRSVTQRSEERRQIPWPDLVRQVYNTLIAATSVVTNGLRPLNALASSVA